MPRGRDGRNYPERSGPASPAYKTGRQASGNGAVQVVDYTHPRAGSRGRVYEHVVVVERALGHVLPEKAVVHHRDEDRAHNDPANLVVCEDQGYHLFLHRRLRAYRACGNAEWFRCRHCGSWDSPKNMYVNLRVGSGNGPLAHHRACHARAAVRPSGRI